MKRSLIIALLCCFAGIVTAQGNYPVDSIFGQRPEVYISLQYEGIKDFQTLNQLVYIDEPGPDKVRAYANRKQFEKLISMGYLPELLTPPSMTGEYPVMMDLDDLHLRNSWNTYPTYEAYEAMMNQFATDYPEMCVIHNIGTLSSGRKILVANIKNDVIQELGKPEVYYSATMHGDEIAGFVLSLRLIDYLLSNYGANDRVTYLVDNLNIWIAPNANPDGTYAGGNHTVWGSTRGNANGVDINRNFPDPRVGPNPDGNPYQPETVLFMDFEEGRNFVLSANMHGGAEVANYPWDTWFKRHADDAWWIYVTREYADTAQFYSSPGYFTDLNNGITNGYDWYSITGGRQDYMNYFRNCREFTLELTSAKRLPAAQLPSRWEWNYRSFLNYFEQALFGVRGVVTNGETNQPIRATITVLGHDTDNSHVYTALPDGNYHRLLKAGTYNLQFSALGYGTQVFENVVVNDRETSILNVQLYTGALFADFTASENDISIGGSVDFTDNSYGQNIVGWEWTFEGGEPASSTEQNPSGITYYQSGTYDVSLTITNNESQSHTLTRSGFIRVSTNYLMHNGSQYACEGTFYDTGGPESNYGDNENLIFTLYPNQADHVVKVQFIEFDVEFHASCSYDYLKIYNGPDLLSPLLGTWCGTNSPGLITADNPQGALTFHFVSDGSITKPGWKAIVECTTAVGLQSVVSSAIQLFPNPVDAGSFTLTSPDPVEFVYFYDSKGTLRKEHIGNDNTILHIQTENLNPGLYMLLVKTQNKRFTSRIIIK